MALTRKVGDIILGKEYRDTITGLQGIATAYTESLDGSIHIMLEPSVDKEGKLVDAVNIDKGQLELVETKKLAAAAPRGGPRSVVKRGD